MPDRSQSGEHLACVGAFRPVGDGKQLRRRLGLRQRTGQRLTNGAAQVVAGDDNGNPRMTHVTPLGPSTGRRRLGAARSSASWPSYEAPPLLHVIARARLSV